MDRDSFPMGWFVTSIIVVILAFIFKPPASPSNFKKQYAALGAQGCVSEGFHYIATAHKTIKIYSFKCEGKHIELIDRDYEVN